MRMSSANVVPATTARSVKNKRAFRRRNPRTRFHYQAMRRGEDGGEDDSGGGGESESGGGAGRRYNERGVGVGSRVGADDYQIG